MKNCSILHGRVFVIIHAHVFVMFSHLFRFTISLQAGPSRDPRNDVALWFNPRFNENFVVRNTLQTGSWGSEERGGGFPFQKGAPTEVVILAKKHHYKVCCYFPCFLTTLCIACIIQTHVPVNCDEVFL